MERPSCAGRIDLDRACLRWDNVPFRPRFPPDPLLRGEAVSSDATMEFIPHEIDRDVFVLLADGGLNRENAAAFTEDIEKMIRRGFTKLIIDCSSLDYISSSGLGTLLVLQKRMKTAGGEVKLCSVKGMVVQALQIIRLDRLFGIYPDLGQARLAFRAERSSSDPPES